MTDVARSGAPTHLHAMRIASLLASATEIVYGLGLGDRLVAVSHECDYPPDALSRPRVSRPRFEVAGLGSRDIDRAVRDAVSLYGSVYELDVEKLRELRPDLILTQGVCEVCAVPAPSARDVASLLEGTPTVLSLDAHTMQGILAAIRSVGVATGVAQRAERYVGELQGRLDRVANLVAGRARPRVLAIEWLDPVFVPGHWTPEMVALAGGELLAGEAGLPSRQLTWDRVAGLDPDVLLVMPCGYKLEPALRDAEVHRERLRWVAEGALRAGRAFVLNGSDYFNRSGPRTVDGVEILAALFHPDLFPDYDFQGKAAVWDRDLMRDRR